MKYNSDFQRNVLLVGEYMSDCSHLFATYYLPKLNCKINEFRHGIPVAREIRAQNYPLIILPCKVAPGYDLSQANDCQELSEIWNMKNEQEERYFEISLQLCKYARADANPNKRSLIVFADTYNALRDNLISNIEKRVTEAGADTYINMFLDCGMDRFFSLVAQRLEWQAKI